MHKFPEIFWPFSIFFHISLTFFELPEVSQFSRKCGNHWYIVPAMVRPEVVSRSKEIDGKLSDVMRQVSNVERNYFGTTYLPRPPPTTVDTPIALQLLCNKQLPFHQRIDGLNKR